MEFDDLLGSRGRHDRSPGRAGSDEGVHFPQLLQKLTQEGTNHLRRHDETEIHYCYKELIVEFAAVVKYLYLSTIGNLFNINQTHFAINQTGSQLGRHKAAI